MLAYSRYVSCSHRVLEVLLHPQQRDVFRLPCVILVDESGESGAWPSTVGTWKTS